MTDMGFPASWCSLALHLSEGDVETASAWVLDNVDMLASLGEAPFAEDVGGGAGGGGDSADASTSQDLRPSILAASFPTAFATLQAAVEGGAIGGGTVDGSRDARVEYELKETTSATKLGPAHNTAPSCTPARGRDARDPRVQPAFALSNGGWGVALLTRDGDTRTVPLTVPSSALAAHASVFTISTSSGGDAGEAGVLGGGAGPLFPRDRFLVTFHEAGASARVLARHLAVGGDGGGGAARIRSFEARQQRRPLRARAKRHGGSLTGSQSPSASDDDSSASGGGTGSDGAGSAFGAAQHDDLGRARPNDRYPLTYLENPLVGDALFYSRTREAAVRSSRQSRLADLPASPFDEGGDDGAAGGGVSNADTTARGDDATVSYRHRAAPSVISVALEELSGPIAPPRTPPRRPADTTLPRAAARQTHALPRGGLHMLFPSEFTEASRVRARASSYCM